MRRKKIGDMLDEQKGKINRAVILVNEGIMSEIVCMHLNTIYEEIYRGTLYKRGIFYAYQQKWDVSVVEIGEGGVAAILETERAIDHYHPNILLFIGMMHGLQLVHPGDVVSATKVYTYDMINPGEVIQIKSNIWNSNKIIEQKARIEVERGSWLQRIKSSAVLEARPDSILAPVVSGAQDIATMTPEVSRQVHFHYKDSVAIEAGGYGIAEAARVNRGIEAMVVGGIVEMLGEHSIDYEERQKNAADHASAFAFEMLAQLENRKFSQALAVTGIEHSSEVRETIEVFYSYVDADEKRAERLRQQLTMLKRSGQISNWYAGALGAGHDVHEHIQHLERAHLILLLVSPDYMASDPHYDIEVKRAMERQKTGEAKVVPILLRPISGLHLASFGQLETIPKNGQAVSLEKNEDLAFKELADEITKIVKSLRSR